MAQGSAEYLTRIIDGELDALLPGLPAIALEGPKGVGKTATGRQRAKTVHSLDEPGQYQVITADPDRLLDGAHPILIDEWQRYPPSWDLVRRAVDEGAEAASYLLAGSSVPAGAQIHSGAGRIVSLRMRPLTLAERGVSEPTVSLNALVSGVKPALEGRTKLTLPDYVREILASGLPGLRRLGDRALRARLDSYVSLIVEREFEEQGVKVRNQPALSRWLRAYAAATSTTATYETIRDAASAGEREKPNRRTTGVYRDVLEQLFVLDPVPGWAPTFNRLRRLSAAPKHQLMDPALAARLLGVDAAALLKGPATPPGFRHDDNLLGQLFESLVTLDVRVYAQAAEARIGHLRTRGGEHEVDLIAERPDGGVVAIEVKLAQVINDHDVRHLRWLRQQLGGSLLDAIVVTTGQEAFRREDGFGVVPAGLLGL